MPKIAPGRIRVRCLGPREPEHWFETPNTDGSNRICAKCRERIRNLNVSPQCEKPQRGGQIED